MILGTQVRVRRGLLLVAVSCVFVFTAEAKAAEAAASAYYNPGNPHNVYMPTVSWQETAFSVTQAGSWCWKRAQRVLRCLMGALCFFL